GCWAGSTMPPPTRPRRIRRRRTRRTRRPRRTRARRTRPSDGAPEVTNGDVILLVVVGLLIIFAGFLALAETGLTRTSRVKAMALAEETGSRRARRLVALVEHSERTLAPVL